MVETGMREGEIQAKKQILNISSLLHDLSFVPCEFYVEVIYREINHSSRKKSVLKTM